MLSNSQNAANRISELLDFKLFWGGGEGACPQTPLEEWGLATHLVVTITCYTFSGRL